MPEERLSSRIFVLRKFDRIAGKNLISDITLIRAARLAELGLGAVDLGGGLYKVRVARENQGKSAGFRTLVVIRKGYVVVYLHAFAKNDQDNLTAKEIHALKLLAEVVVAWSDAEIAESIGSGGLRELKEKTDQ